MFLEGCIRECNTMPESSKQDEANTFTISLVLALTLVVSGQTMVLAPSLALVEVTHSRGTVTGLRNRTSVLTHQGCHPEFSLEGPWVPKQRKPSADNYTCTQTWSLGRDCSSDIEDLVVT